MPFVESPNDLLYLNSFTSKITTSDSILLIRTFKHDIWYRDPGMKSIITSETDVLYSALKQIPPSSYHMHFVYVMLTDSVSFKHIHLFELDVVMLLNCTHMLKEIRKFIKEKFMINCSV